MFVIATICVAFALDTRFVFVCTDVWFACVVETLYVKIRNGTDKNLLLFCMHHQSSQCMHSTYNDIWTFVRHLELIFCMQSFLFEAKTICFECWSFFFMNVLLNVYINSFPHCLILLITWNENDSLIVVYAYIHTPADTYLQTRARSHAPPSNAMLFISLAFEEICTFSLSWHLFQSLDSLVSLLIILIHRNIL